jgi:EmrB/QacA subfamily drug resistance transporter
VLAVIAVTQLTISVDASIANIALPHAQTALHISNADRQWVVTAYTLTFGGFILLGGRIADYAGRKRVLVIGLLGFAGASALGGLAPDAAVLFGARAVQGAFAAILAPAALSLLSVTFADPVARAKAFGVYGSVSGGGLAIGMIAGGVLTQFASWRWCLLVNTPIAMATAVAAVRLVTESRGVKPARYDLPGALSSTGGLISLVYGLTNAEVHGWGSFSTIAPLIVAAALIAVFAAIERTSRAPLLPLRVVSDRNRGGSFLASALLAAALFGSTLFLTYFLQGSRTLDYSPLQTGLAFLPLSVGSVISATVASSLLSNIAPRSLMSLGLLLAAGGMLWFTGLRPHSSYWPHVFPGEVMLSLGIGLVLVPLASTALLGVSGPDSGVASAMISTSQQVGGSVGIALMNSIAAAAATRYVAAHGVGLGAEGEVRGFTAGYLVGLVFLAIGLAVTIIFVNAKKLGTPGVLGDAVVG